MTITDRVAQIIDQGTTSEGRFSGGAEADQYKAFNDAGVECEVGELFYAMVRTLKPMQVLETGTHRGISTIYIALALADNGFGVVDTLEFIPEHFEFSNHIFKKTDEICDHINNMRGDVTKWTPKAGTRYQMALLDTEPQLRFGEFVRFFDYVTDGGYVFIHDLPRNMCQGNINPDWPNITSWPFGELPGSMRQWIKKGKIKKFHFPTPRGLTGLYKTHPDDYELK